MVNAMRFVIAPNTFKECISAPKAAEAIGAGVRRVFPDAEIVLVPLADGGDGTTEALVAARKGRFLEITANDPLMRPVKVRYGLFDDDRAAVVEMAAASGLWRLRKEERNPLKTTTYGTGEMIRDALNRGVRSLIVGIGGSATTDGGIGMAAALGYRFFDRHDNELAPIGESMRLVSHIDKAETIDELKDTQIYVASDVTNPLLGSDGAAQVYGPQKGATPEMVEILEEGLSVMERRWEEDLGVRIGDLSGGGAAGGLGAGLVAFCGAEIRSGFDLVAEYAHLDEALEGATLVLTGEGRMDASSQFGKVPAGVIRKARDKYVPVIGLAGIVAGDSHALIDRGMTALFSITPGPISLSEAFETVEENLRRTTEQVMRLWRYRV